MKTIILLVFLVITVTLTGQEIQQQVIATAGNYSESETVSVSWTLGEVAIETFKNESITLSQGFQQGDLTINTLVEESLLDFSLSAYPNPVLDRLTVEFDMDNLPYQVVDLNGKVILNGTLYTRGGTIDFSRVSEGVYFLVIDKTRTHKILKK